MHLYISFTVKLLLFEQPDTLRKGFKQINKDTQ